VLGDLRLYPPWDWILWDRLYGVRAPLLFRNAGGLTTLASLVGCAVVIVAALGRKEQMTIEVYDCLS
jgi:hypothetical protein